jgi:hypothetical protein
MRTSNFGTIVNAFQAYCMYSYQHYTRKTPKECFDLLGIYFGDDGVSADLRESVAKTVTNMSGMTLKADVRPSNKPISFLGRIYTDLTLSMDSFSDVARHVRKMHVTTAPNSVSDLEALKRKADGFTYTDPNTPFISNWASFILRNTKEVELSEIVISDENYFAKNNLPFPEIENVEFAKEVIAITLDISVTDLTKFEMWFDTDHKQNIQTIKFNKINEIKFKLDCVINGRNINLPIDPTVGGNVTKHSKASTRTCN